MMKLASSLEIPFARVVYGKYSVQLVVRSYLHIFLQVDQHGAVLDFVAYFDRQHREAKRWLEVVIRLLRICIRSELEQSGCKVHPLTGEVPCCCHYHQPVSPDVIDCRAVPLCPQCLLHATEPERHVLLASTAAHQLPHCKQGGHELGADAMCFQMWREQELQQQQERQAVELQQQQEVSHQQAVIDELIAVNRKLDWLQASSDQVKVSLSCGPSCISTGKCLIYLFPRSTYRSLFSAGLSAWSGMLLTAALSFRMRCGELVMN